MGVNRRTPKKVISINVEINEKNTIEYNGDFWDEKETSYYESLRQLIDELMTKETALLNEFIEKIESDENLNKNNVYINIKNPYAAYIKDYVVLMSNHALKRDDYVEKVRKDLEKINNGTN